MYSVQLHPSVGDAIVFAPFAIPILIGMVGILLLWAILRQSIWVLLPLGILIIGHKHIKAMYAVSLFQPGTSNLLENPSIRILSYNVHVFGAYSETSEASTIYAFIKEQDADVVCLQEFFHDQKTQKYNLVKKLGRNYPYRFYTPNLKNKQGAAFGLCILSKYPITRKEIISFDNKTPNHALYGNIKIGKKTLALYNVHLQSMSIDEKHLREAEWTRQTGKNLFTILKKFKAGSRHRASQSDLLLQHAEIQKEKSILFCGDFNDTPFSYTYHAFSRKYTNAHTVAGRGWGTTYSGTLPLLRIDHMFFSQSITCAAFTTFHETTMSDHYPILGTFVLE